MNIYINGRFLLQKCTGVERFAYNMCKSFVSNGHNINIIIPKNGKIHNDYDVSQFNIKRFGVCSSHIWEQLVLPFFFIGKKDYVLLSFTGLGSILVPNKVMTIHDLSFLENRNWFSAAYYHYYKQMTPLAVKTSRHIITVSNFSKDEILRFYRFLKPEQITVVYNATDSNLFKPTKSEADANSNYVLAVSSIDPRKNFAQLIKAFGNISNCTLKIVGAHNRVFNSSAKDSNIQQNKDNIEYLGRVTDKELVELYSGAKAFIFPSLYEGFGLPPIEAMMCGCPVLVSDIPVLREICKDAAIYFNPKDAISISSAIDSILLKEENERNEIIQKGFENAKRFSWTKSVETLINTLSNL
ncbi:MAG: glycosyltransferase family 4 protein [Bacteroidaceae bacterium]|nr:glycosyltransferase family 4 protein [Bacteroidaceae bacterium]